MATASYCLFLPLKSASHVWCLPQHAPALGERLLPLTLRCLPLFVPLLYPTP